MKELNNKLHKKFNIDLFHEVINNSSYDELNDEINDKINRELYDELENLHLVLNVELKYISKK